MMKPRVKLLGHTPEPDRLVSAAAKLCYSRVGAEDILEGLSGNSFANNAVFVDVDRSASSTTISLFCLPRSTSAFP
jgi:hypothetical protein